jgi:hypothetical protein
MEDVVDHILPDIGTGFDGRIHLCRVEGFKSIDAVEYLARPTIRQIDVMLWIGIRCVRRIHHFWMESVLSTNLRSQPNYCTMTPYNASM